MSAQIQTYERAFEALEEERAGEPGWLAKNREQAWASFAAHGLPTTRHERWKYTNLRSLRDFNFAHPLTCDEGQVTAQALEQVDFKELESIKLVFVDGLYRPELSTLLTSLPPRAVLGSLRAALETEPEAVEPFLGKVVDEGRPFVDLNSALFVDGCFLHLPRGAALDLPVHLIHVATERASAEGAASAWTRNLLVLEPGSQAVVMETYVGPAGAPHLSDVVTEVIVSDNAHLTHVRVQDEGSSATAVYNTHARLGRDANFKTFSLSLGGALVRNEMIVSLAGQGGFCDLQTAYPLTGQQHVDNHTEVHHKAAHCDSNQLYKGVAHDRSKCVFQGLIHVYRDAQKTNAIQSNPNLVLSEGAVADTKPQLEIYADDVRCTHGATVGQLDPKQTFYLRSRGMDLEAARLLLTRGFAVEVIDNLVDALPESMSKPVEERLTALLDARMSRFGS